MTITLYPCGCIHLRNRLAPAAPARCNYHQTEPDEVFERSHGFVWQNGHRYIWTSDQPPWVEVTGQILQDKLHGPELGSVDGATFRPVGGRRQIWIF